ncbi:MAG TPA: DUF4388 domain-containing protein [Vicinamibacteria bacterium]
MKGSLCQGTIPVVLGRLYVDRQSGLLHLTRGEERRSARFRKGHIVHADTTVAEDHMGEVLVRHGLLSAADLNRATARVMRERKRLGQVLQELRVLDEHLLEEALALHVREVLRKAFEWEAGGYAFEAQPVEVRLEEDATLKVFTGELILDAARSVRDPAAVRRALGDPDRLIVLTADPVLRFQQITLNAAESDVLARIDGTRTLRQLVAALSLPPEETERSVLGLLCLGMAEQAPGRER